MKDNKENLNNEALESVAGGKLSAWTTKKRKLMKLYFGDEKSMDIMNSVGPIQFGINVRKSPVYTLEEKKEILSMLGKKL